MIQTFQRVSATGQLGRTYSLRDWIRDGIFLFQPLQKPSADILNIIPTHNQLRVLHVSQRINMDSQSAKNVFDPLNSSRPRHCSIQPGYHARRTDTHGPDAFGMQVEEAQRKLATARESHEKDLVGCDPGPPRRHLLQHRQQDQIVPDAAVRQELVIVRIVRVAAHARREQRRQHRRPRAVCEPDQRVSCPLRPSPAAVDRHDQWEFSVACPPRRRLGVLVVLLRDVHTVRCLGARVNRRCYEGGAADQLCRTPVLWRDVARAEEPCRRCHAGCWVLGAGSRRCHLEESRVS